MASPWPLAEQLNFAHRNMLPRLQIVIRRQEFGDFSTLEYLATRVKRSYLAEKNYRPPLPPEKLIFPDLAYHAPKGKAKNPVTVATATSNKKEKKKANKAVVKKAEFATENVTANKTSDSTTAAAAINTEKSNIKCWNCEKTGHRARDCTEQRHIYCYRCGKREVTVKTYPTCTENADRSQ